MKFKVGDVVLVKISGLEIPAIVKAVLKNNDYIVKYEAGNEEVVNEKYLKGNEDLPVKFKSKPEENEKQSTRRSPSRRSPGRTPSSPSKSPSRKRRPASPARRKSPARKPIMQQAPVVESPVKPLMNFPRRRRPIDELSSQIFNSTEIINDTNKKIDYEPEIKKDFIQEETQFVLHLKPSEEIIQDLGKFSDDDEIKERKSVEKERKSEPKQLIPPKEFGGIIGALSNMLLIPLSVLFLHVFCSKNSCHYTTIPNLEKYKFLNTYFDINVLGIYMFYVLLIAVLSLIPFVGKKINSQPSKIKIRTYRMNGLFSAFVVYSILALTEWMNLSIIDFMYENYFKFLITSLVFGVVMSIILFVKSSFVPISSLNTHAVSYNFLYDFFMGREVNPTIFWFDVKMILVRIALINVLLFNSIFLYKSLNINFDILESTPSLDHVELSPTFLTACVLQLVYVLDVLVFESGLTTTFEVQYEGTGFMVCVGYAAFPFMFTAVTKYLHDTKLENNFWILLAIIVTYAVGYVIYRASNAQKHAFRINPYDPAFSEMESIPTSHGKRLLVSKYWGWVRHPNYLGDILMQLAMGAVCWWSPAALGVVVSMPFLAHRAVRLDRRLERRYGPAWLRYCQRVPYRIIPRVY